MHDLKMKHFNQPTIILIKDNLTIGYTWGCFLNEWSNVTHETWSHAYLIKSLLFKYCYQNLNSCNFFQTVYAKHTLLKIMLEANKWRSLLDRSSDLCPVRIYMSRLSPVTFTSGLVASLLAIPAVILSPASSSSLSLDEGDMVTPKWFNRSKACCNTPIKMTTN